MKRFSLSSEERIKNKKEFDRVYKFGKTIISSDKKLKAIFLFEQNLENPGVKIAVAVAKKAGTAVWRNKVKRLVRESYRLNKHPVIDLCIEKKSNLRIIVSPYYLSESKNEFIKLHEFMPSVLELLDRIKNET
ncbi:MAG TPA: ribonuclease P protein component [Ignavibacteriaceae bacterium]|nr:ribonuclease P protein component [Ignavibacteriaceae bacterium]